MTWPRVTKITYVLYEHPNDKAAAVCSVVLDDCIKLRLIHIYDYEDGLDIKLPCQFVSNKSGSAGMFNRSRNVYHFVNDDFSDYVKDCITQGYEHCLKTGAQCYYPQ